MKDKRSLNSIVAFLSPPSRSFNHYRPPLALMYLAGYLEKNGYDSEIVDIVIPEQVRDIEFLKSKKNLLRGIRKKICNQVKKIRPDIIGITCYTPEYFEVLDLARAIKKIDNQIKIIVGGVHPTFYPEDFCYPKSDFDIAVIGEGEITMLEIVSAIRHGGNMKNIDGIAYYDQKKQKLTVTPKRNLCQDLDSISYPSYDKIDMKYYTTASPYAVRGIFSRSVYILYSRGCPSQCTFCVAKRLRSCNGIGNYVRLRDPKKVVEEILFLKEKYHIDSFFFIDDLFTLDKRKVKEFCQLMINAKAKLLWGCSSKVTTVDYQTLKTMRKAGCLQIDFGVERGSDEALRYIKKGITVKIIKRVFKDCHRLDIRTFANMLVNIPEETEKDLNDIVKLLEQIKPTIAFFNTFTPFPGTEIFDQYADRFTKEDYPKLLDNLWLLIRKYPEKFRFAKHNIDFQPWIKFYYKKFNKIIPNIKVYFTIEYLASVFNSKNKIDYLKQSGLLMREFINQKFSKA